MKLVVVVVADDVEAASLGPSAVAALTDGSPTQDEARDVAVAACRVLNRALRDDASLGVPLSEDQDPESPDVLDTGEDGEPIF